MKWILEFQMFDGDGHVLLSECEVKSGFLFQDEWAGGAFCRFPRLSVETNGTYKIRLLGLVKCWKSCNLFWSLVSDNQKYQEENEIQKWVKLIMENLKKEVELLLKGCSETKLVHNFYQNRLEFI